MTTFECTPITGIHGEKGVEIGTPFTYADGTSIVLYALEHGEHVLVSDNGDMLAHLSSVGINTGSAATLRALRERVLPFGLTLTDECDVRGVFPRDQAQYRLARAISALLAVAEWEREHVGVPAQTADLANEVEMYLRQWRPTATFSKYPVVKGNSGRSHKFDFLQGSELIDVLSPNHTATGAAMRKAGDVLMSAAGTEYQIRVVIDDRRNPQLAETERHILGSMVKAMTLTSLRNAAPPTASNLH